MKKLSRYVHLYVLKIPLIQIKQKQTECISVLQLIIGSYEKFNVFEEYSQTKSNAKIK